MIVAFLALSIRHTNRLRGGIEPLPYSLIVDYLHHGYSHYQQMRVKHEDARSVRVAETDREVQRALQRALDERTERERRERLVRIESNRRDLLGEGEEIGKAVCTTLQPFAALLSRVL